MSSTDTILAPSSATGPAARMIVRLSGPRAWEMAKYLCGPIDLQPSHASRGTLHLPALGGLPLPVTIYSFLAPKSYTGEDLIEFHLPGNPLLACMLLEEAIAYGARPAEAGEFTARAYAGGRIDLAQAEGIAASIAAQNEQELRAARQLLSGELARRLQPVLELITKTLALIEVGIDFSEEDVTFLSPLQIAERILRIEGMLQEIVDQSSRFEKLAHEPRAVLVGRPNAGKSTLLNTLAGRERAVVSPVAGTTRDAVSVDVPLRRGMLRLVDVAGIEEGAECSMLNAENERNALSSANPEHSAFSISTQMRRRAMHELETADLVLLVHDAASSQPPLSLPRPADLLIYSKSDLPHNQREGFLVSARTGENLCQLLDRLDELAFGSPAAATSLALNARHIRAIDDARAALSRASDSLLRGPELIAFEFRDALDALGRILGNVSPDDLLGHIFSSFCIGK